MAKKEYIERGALIKAITESTEATWGNGLGRSWWSHSVQLKDNMVRCINNQIVADVVEVVRCKDCKHYERLSLDCDDYYCMAEHTMSLFSPCKDDFCSYGERKDHDR